MNKEIPLNWNIDGKLHVLVIRGDNFSTFDNQINELVSEGGALDYSLLLDRFASSVYEVMKDKLSNK